MDGTRYDLEVTQLSVNGFVGAIEFNDLNFDECLTVMKQFKNYYAYVCEYKITKAKEEQ